MTTCGERLAHLLDAWGVDTAFGIPGTHTIELYRGIPATRIRHVTPRHEQGAGFMADGFARFCGRPAACITVALVETRAATPLTAPPSATIGRASPVRRRMVCASS